MSAKRGYAYLWLGIALFLILLFAAAPLLSAVIASTIADALHCTVNEGGGAGCIFRGSDISETLAEMFVAGWLTFITVPIAVVALAIWLIVAIIVVVVRWRRRGAAM